MSGNRRQEEDDDDGALTPVQRLGNSIKRATYLQMVRNAVAPARDDSAGNKPLEPRSRVSIVSKPRVFKADNIFNDTTSGCGSSQSSMTQPQKELVHFVKSAVFKSKTGATQQSESGITKPCVSPTSVVHVEEGKSRPTLAKKGSMGAIEHSPPQRNRTSPALKGPRPPRRHEELDDERDTGRRRKTLTRHLSNASMNASIIEDPNKLETRWNWAELLVQHAFKPYLKALTENNELLPDLEELDIGGSEDREDELVDEVRDQMLNDGVLAEREIAAFFLGFTLFNVKVKSLQSQLESAKTNVPMPVVPNSMDKATNSVEQKNSSDLVHGNSHDFVDTKEKQPASDPSPPREVSGKSISIMRIHQDPNIAPENQRLLKELEEAEKKQKKLEKQMKQAGIQIAEEIPYEVAKAKIAKIAERMQQIGSSEVTHEDKQMQAKLREEYYKLEQEMERYSAALMMTDEYIEKQAENEMVWEGKNEEPNKEALKKLRRHMPVEVKSMSEAQLCSQPTPNGKRLPKEIARKFKRTNVLQLLRTNPEDVYRMHPSTLEQLRVVGMTLTERRAMYAHLKDVGTRWKAMQSDALTERKWAWYTMMRTNFKETLAKYDYHVQQYGPPENHQYATRENPKEGCPMIGRQCPLRADQHPCYDDDYGFTQDAEYEVTVIRKADADGSLAQGATDAAALVRENRASERIDALKKHYGSVLQVTLANGSCETMDEALDAMETLREKWIELRISQGNEPATEETKRKEMHSMSDALNDLRLSVLQFAERSGMQLTGKRDANADKMDMRSPLELGLCEEVYQSANDVFSGIEHRMEELSVRDGRMKVAIDQLRELLDELHERNVKSLERLGLEQRVPSRKRKTREAMVKAAEDKLRATDEATSDDTDNSSRIPPALSRDNLVAAIAARRQGDDFAGSGGDTASGVAVRRVGGSNARGRGNLMSAITSKGAGRGGRGGRGGRSLGGRGHPLSAARGGRGARGDLMAAIAARSSGRNGGQRGGRGGRSELMSAIAARGAIRGGSLWS